MPFSTRLPFSTPVLEPGPVEATLVGGRIDSLEGRSVAAVVKGSVRAASGDAVAHAELTTPLPKPSSAAPNSNAHRYPGDQEGECGGSE
jgi:hypothetical protein